MGHLLGQNRYLHAAERTLRAAWLVMEKYPTAHSTLLNALEETLNPPDIVILRGERADIRTWQKELAKVYGPHRLVIAVPSDLPPALADKPATGSTVAYVCTGSVCSAPIEHFSELVEQLRST